MKTNFTIKPKKASSIALVCCLAFFCISLLLLALCRLNLDFAELYCKTASHTARLLLGYATSVVPFSICEAIVFVCVPLAIVLAIVYVVKRKYKSLKRLFVFCLCTAMLFTSFSCIAFYPLYSRRPINEHIGIKRRDISVQELENTYSLVTQKLNEITKSGEISFAKGGLSYMPYSIATLGDKINLAYADLQKREGFDVLTKMNVRAKPLICSEYMTYTHLSGMYTFTGEANVNINYPDYIVAYTYAHELAHQRGIARENEANFVAFLVLLESKDKYLNYCAYRNMWDYLQNALAHADYDACVRITRETNAKIRGEQRAYSEFFKRYTNSRASEVAEVINDTALKLNNEKQGTKSYGMVVDLVVAYYADSSNND